MMLRWSGKADEDMYDILLYIAEDNLERALTFTKELEDEADKLVEYPQLGVRLDGYSDAFRILHYKGYSIVYEIRETDIMVHEVFNQSKQSLRPL